MSLQETSRRLLGGLVAGKPWIKNLRAKDPAWSLSWGLIGVINREVFCSGFLYMLDWDF